MSFMLKDFSLMIGLFSATVLSAQTELKVNTVFVPMGIYNIAVEKPVNSKISLQAEAFVSPWKSFLGKNLQMYMGTLEGRYYFKETGNKWYVGTYLSMAAFNLQKWNYWSKTVVEDKNGNLELLPDGSVRVTERYQKGLAFIWGVSGGYHFVLDKKWGLDVFAGVGFTQSLYKGYMEDNNQRYDGATKWNKSGEILPTRAGVMLTYKLE